MLVFTGEETAAYLNNITHLDTQRAAFGIDLSVAEVYRLTGPGRLDFGGSEYEEAARERLRPARYQPDDDYGWWELDGGTYLVRYNEAARPGDKHLALVQPLARLLKAGAYHPAFHVQEAQAPLETLLVVGERGCRLKENCRISRLLLLDASL